jgi:chromosome segregation ATPase
MNKLDEAKINLKKTIEKLEKAVDKKLIHAKNSPAVEVLNKVNALQDEVNKLSQEVDDKKDEINYLREQNAELQAGIGEEQHKTFQLENKNRETAKKIDQVIVRVQSYLVEKGMV